VLEGGHFRVRALWGTLSFEVMPNLGVKVPAHPVRGSASRRQGRPREAESEGSLRQNAADDQQESHYETQRLRWRDITNRSNRKCLHVSFSL
jgi:hypothetical protein